VSLAMQPTPSVRLGLVRPSGAASRPVVAEIEARVLRHELGRRLGTVVLDLRTDGPAIGPWQPLANAGWPATIDARIDADALWSEPVGLTALAGRTVDPAIVDVRRRMLVHLGIIPVEPQPLDAARLAALDSLLLRPLDLWLIASEASEVDTGEAAVDALTVPPGDAAVARLDGILDEIAAGLTDVTGTATVAALADEVAALRARVAELEDEAVRTMVETNARLDELAHERAVLLDRAERDRLDGAAVG
jgi:hypothetical protein